MLGQALVLHRQTGNKNGEANTLSNLGLAYVNMRQPQKALDYWGQALVLHRQLGYKNGEAGSLTNLGVAWRNMGQPQKALEYYEQALPLHRQTGNKAFEANTLSELGEVYSDLGQPQKALEYLGQALVLYRQTGNQVQEASTLINLGIAYSNLGQPQKGLDYFGQALSLYQQTGNKTFEANTLVNLGKVYSNLGQPQKALDCFGQALSLYRQIGNKSGEAGTLTSLGNIYSDLGQLQKALDYMGQALTLQRQNNDTSNEAGTLTTLGIIHRALGHSQKALDYYGQALSLYRQLGDKDGEAASLTNLGVACRSMGQPQKALEYYEQALPLHRQTGNKTFEANTLTNLGEVYSDLGQPQKALDHYKQGLFLHRQVGHKDAEAETLNNMGLVYHALRQPQKALDYYGQSLACYEQIRAATVADAQTRATFLARYIGVYRCSLSVLLESHTPAQTAQAFSVAQQMKSRALLEISAGKASLHSRLTEAERAKESELRRACDTLNARLVAEGVTNAVGSKKRSEALRGELEKAERDLSAFTDLLYARYPDVAASQAAHAATPAQVAHALPFRTALIEFAQTETNKGKNTNVQTVAFVITGGKKQAVLKAVPVALSGKELEKVVSELRAGVVDPRRGKGIAWKAPARRLYNALISPLERTGALAGVSRLVLCPSGVLWDVPFAALLDAKNCPLLSRFTLSQAASASVYVAAHDRATRQAQEREKTSAVQVLAFADPTFAAYKSGFGNDPALPGQRPLPAPDRPLPAPDRPLPAADRPLPAADRPLPTPDRAVLLPESLRGARLAALPGTRREADAIHATFPRASVFLGSQAQEGTVKQLAPTCRYLHVATHGFVNDTAPLLSSLVLAEPPKNGPGSGEDGFLTARELLDLDLSHVEMVTLSACNTARGQNQSGEGVVGLTWALFAAGCPTQVLSQWAVNDASTASLMEQFYANLKVGKPKAKALRQAALSVSRHSATAHPYYWAPFVLFGSDE